MHRGEKPKDVPVASQPKPSILSSKVDPTSLKPGTIFRDVDEPWCPEMVVIPAGSFLMGSPDDELGRYEREGPQHRVTIEEPFAIARYPTTFGEYDYFCSLTGTAKPEDEGWGRNRRPVINVSWHDAKSYCLWISEMTGAEYLLPSEAWWEYACRAGSEKAFSFGDEIGNALANFSRDKTSEVGIYPANAFGLFDMHGNVTEWCEDLFHDDYMGTPIDGSPWLAGTASGRMLRGGSFSSERASGVRAAMRWGHYPQNIFKDVGFRCARIIS
jgi:formylglycine-generating enzyme required for sulfatase activity